MRESLTSTISRDVPPARPLVAEKKTYVPHSAPEEFIVPLLRREIEMSIERFATPALGLRRAIDIGSGGQPFRSLLEQIGYDYCAVDVNSTEGPVDVQCAIDGQLPEELMHRGPFDFALCTEVLEHVADWGAAFANLASLLASGGRVLVTTPHFYHLHEEPYDFWRPTLHAIAHYARGAGLEPVYQHSAGNAWGVLGTALGSCQFTSASGGLTDRVLAKVVRGIQRIVFATLRAGRVQRRVKADARLYLSNIVVLQKGQHVEA